jgi:hypothetical protein
MRDENNEKKFLYYINDGVYQVRCWIHFFSNLP